jgi:hypothetical protein
MFFILNYFSGMLKWGTTLGKSDSLFFWSIGYVCLLSVMKQNKQKNNMSSDQHNSSLMQVSRCHLCHLYTSLSKLSLGERETKHYGMVVSNNYCPSSLIEVLCFHQNPC